MTSAAGPVRKRAAREPLVIFSPYAPSANGIADYVGELMPYHRADFDVTLVIADDAVVPVEGQLTPRVLLASEFRRHRAFFANAPKLYHVGNNPDHCYMLDFLARDPGIVVLHDYNLNYMHEVATQGWKGRNGYWPALQLEYGMIGKDEVRSRFERRDRGQFATYELPLNGDVLEAATGIITHARYVQYKVAARVPHKPVWYVPHHLSPAVAHYAQITRGEARQQLDLSESEIVITAPGFITYAKRIPMLLSALSALRTRVPPFRLVLAGEKCPDQYDVDTDIAAAGLKGCTTVTGYLSEADFFKHLAACDLVANLRHPTGGEMSGTLIRALGMGAPAIVLDIGPMGELPRTVVQKVAWEGDRHAALMAALYVLISDKTRRQQLGARAAAYARNTHNIEKIAARYAEIVRSTKSVGAAEEEPARELFPHPRIVAQRIRQLAEEVSPTAQLPVDGRVWWQCAKAPLGQDGRRALLVVPHPSETASFFARAFDWRAADITAMALEDFLAPRLRDHGGNPIPQGTFSFALVIAPTALPEISAAALLRRLNAALRRGGNLTFEIWSELDQENYDVPLAEPHIAERLADAGFAEAGRVSRRHDGFFAEAVPAVSEGADARRLVCFTARKASSVAFWRFMVELEGKPNHFGGRIG